MSVAISRLLVTSLCMCDPPIVWTLLCEQALCCLDSVVWGSPLLYELCCMDGQAPPQSNLCGRVDAVYTTSSWPTQQIGKLASSGKKTGSDLHCNFLSDPCVHGVRSMGPNSLTAVHWVHWVGQLCRLLRFNWCDSGWWRYQLNTNR